MSERGIRPLDSLLDLTPRKPESPKIADCRGKPSKLTVVMCLDECDVNVCLFAVKARELVHERQTLTCDSARKRDEVLGVPVAETLLRSSFRQSLGGKFT